MTDWPKKMWMSFAESVNAHRDQVFNTDIPVLVYLADQAREPVAWRFRIDRYGKQVWCYQDSVAPEISCQSLYLAPPPESAIRASERERCAKVVESRYTNSPTADALAAAIRGLGD